MGFDFGKVQMRETENKGKSKRPHLSIGGPSVYIFPFLCTYYNSILKSVFLH